MEVLINARIEKKKIGHKQNIVGAEAPLAHL